MELNEVEAVAAERFAALFDVEADGFLARSASIKRSDSLIEVHGRLGSIAETLRELLEQFMCQYKEQLVALALKAVDTLADLDLPYVPNIVVEPAIDTMTRQYGKWLIESTAARVCPK